MDIGPSQERDPHHMKGKTAKRGSGTNTMNVAKYPHKKKENKEEEMEKNRPFDVRKDALEADGNVVLQAV